MRIHLISKYLLHAYYVLDKCKAVTPGEGDIFMSQVNDQFLN